MRPIVLDTDIGTDESDIMALALALRSPELELLGVTTVYGDVDLRARIVQKVFDLAEQAPPPIGRGCARPLLPHRSVSWAGHEGAGLLDGSESDLVLPHAATVMGDAVRQRPGEVSLVAIGPLTNLAATIIVMPEIVPLVREVVIMGGVVGRGPALGLPPVEYNIRCDPEAAAVVLAAGWPITLVGLDVTMQVPLDPQHLDHLARSRDPLAQALADQTRRAKAHDRREASYLHAPLAIMTLIDASLVTTQPMHVVVEMHGQHTTGSTVALAPRPDRPVNAAVCLGVQAAAARDLFLSRVT